MTKLYYDNINDVWWVGNHIVNPANILTEVSGTNITISNAGDNERIYYKGSIAELVRSDNTAYGSLANLLSENKILFTGSNASGGALFKKFSVEITRPANTTVYSPNDVVADVTAAFKPILNVAKAAGAGVKIVRARIQTEDTGVAGARFNLHLYKEAPTFIADNAPFAVAYANAVKRIGAIPIVMGTGNMNTVGMNDYNQVILNPTSRDVYWILETVSGFTPSANSTRFTISIDCELSN